MSGSSLSRSVNFDPQLAIRIYTSPDPGQKETQRQRMERRPETKMNRTPLKAIRSKCIGCAGSARSVRICTFSDCPLFAYRLGRNPNRSGIGGNPLFSSRKSLLKLGVSSLGQEKRESEGSDKRSQDSYRLACSASSCGIKAG